MKASLRWVATLVLYSLLQGQQVMGQGAQDILDQIPVRVKAANPVTNGSQIDFGAAVALDGEVLVIGAPGEDSATDPMVFDTGAVYVFQREGGGWVEKQQLTSPSEAAFEEFGSSVGVALGDVDVDYLIVGAPGAGGSAYIFKRMGGGSWEFDATLVQDEPQAGDLFGTSVAIDYFEPANSPKDDKVFVAAVGAPQNRDPAGSGSQQGSVSIFQPTGDPSTWGRTEEFFGLVNGDRMGVSLAMASDYVVVGTEGLDGTGFNGGGAYVTIVAANQQPAGWLQVQPGHAPCSPRLLRAGVGQGLSVAAEHKPSPSSLQLQRSVFRFPTRSRSTRVSSWSSDFGSVASPYHRVCGHRAHGPRPGSHFRHLGGSVEPNPGRRSAGCRNRWRRLPVRHGSDDRNLDTRGSP